jgi:hypothetical protein
MKIRPKLRICQWSWAKAAFDYNRMSRPAHKRWYVENCITNLNVNQSVSEKVGIMVLVKQVQKDIKSNGNALKTVISNLGIDICSLHEYSDWRANVFFEIITTAKKKKNKKIWER